MNFRALTKDDIDYMREHTVDKDFYKDKPEQTDFSYALEHKGETLGVGGFHMMNMTTAVCWFDLSDAAGDHVIVCYRVIKEWLDIFCKEQGILRLEAYVKTGFEAGIRTVEHLGFQWQYRAMKYFGQCPADVFVKYFGDK